MEWSRATELRVGLFVVVSLVVGVAIVVAVGVERQIFEERIYYKTTFSDAGGLKKSVSVRVGGVSAGNVVSVRFPDDPKRKRVVVVFSVSDRYRDRIRLDSIARIGSKGVLGDKTLDVSAGTSDTEAVPAWGWVRSGRATGMLDRATDAVAKAEETLEQARRVLEIFTDEGMVRDIQGTIRNLHEITEAMSHGEGVSHALLHDPRTAESLQAALNGIASSSRELAGASREIQTLVRDVRTGRGALHALIYEREGADALAKIGRASDELATLMHDVRTERGLLHSLIYTDEQANLLANLTETSAGVRQIVADLRAGRGTIGALLVDPSVYEDLKRVVGNVGRSRALRALVRYSITEDERAPGAPEVRRPEQDGNDGQDGHGGR